MYIYVRVCVSNPPSRRAASTLRTTQRYPSASRRGEERTQPPALRQIDPCDLQARKIARKKSQGWALLCQRASSAERITSIAMPGYGGSVLDYIHKASMCRKKVRSDRLFDNVDYTQLAETDNGFFDSQFESPPVKIPWKAITLAGLLFVGGSVMFLIGSLIMGGKIDSKYSDRMWPVIILGVLMFIPGAYHMRVAILAYQRVPGYSFDDIPEFD